MASPNNDVDLELEVEDSIANLDLREDEASKNSPIEEEDSDDDFGDFDEFEGAQEDTSERNSAVLTNNDPSASVTTAYVDPPASADGPKPLKSSDIGKLSPDDIRSILPRPPIAAAQSENDEEDGTTPTSQALWQHLTEPTWMPLPQWEGSPIHRQLVLHLGIPLDLDSTLSHKESKKPEALLLPTQLGKHDVEGVQHIPEWSLSMLSEQAIQTMNSEELTQHTNKLQGILDEAEKLKDAMESREMDLLGEKNILEGMVESLLAFSQRKQRERLQRKTSKSQR